MNDIFLLSKPIISIFDCKFVGTCTGLYFKKNYKCAFIETNYNNLKYLINTNDVVSIENDGILIKNLSTLLLKSSLELELNDKYKIDSSFVYSIDGVFMGNVKNILIDKNFNITQIHTDKNSQIEKNMIYNLSSEIILINEKKTKNTIFKYKPKNIPKTTPLCESLIVSTEKSLLVDKNLEYTSTSLNPSKSISNILNRQITKDIYTLNGEIIAKNGSKITRENIKKARTFGKLFELIKYSK